MSRRNEAKLHNSENNIKEDKNISENNEIKSEETLENKEINNIKENENTSESKSGLQAETIVMDEPVGIVVGSRVKVKKDVGNDMLGKRIHNGIKNYVYTVKVVRPDGYCTIECMAYQFTLSKEQLDLQ